MTPIPRRCPRAGEHAPHFWHREIPYSCDGRLRVYCDGSQAVVTREPGNKHLCGRCGRRVRVVL